VVGYEIIRNEHQGTKRVLTEVHHREPEQVRAGMEDCNEWLWEMQGENQKLRISSLCRRLCVKETDIRGNPVSDETGRPVNRGGTTRISSPVSETYHLPGFFMERNGCYLFSREKQFSNCIKICAGGDIL